MSTPYAGGGEPSPEQIDILAQRGIPITAAIEHGVLFVQTGGAIPEGSPDYWSEWLPAIFFPWRMANGEVEWQIRPDTPAVLHDGSIAKYATRSRDDGFEQPLWLARQGTVDGVRLLVEGTCQTLAAATWAPEGTTVVGMIGCRGWSSDGLPLPDLAQFEGTETVVVLDADMHTNPDVWDAGEALQTALNAEGATVRFLRVPGSKKSGLDDALGKRPMNLRTSYLANLIETAEREKFPKSRRPKPKADPDSFFGDGGLRVEKLAADIFKAYPSALTREGEIALYRDTGVYEPSGMAFSGEVAKRLGDDFRPGHRAAAEEFTAGTLHRTGRTLPDHAHDPLLNVTNGMLDLVTLTLKPHDPVYMSRVQFPIEWDPTAKCPAYEQWAESVGILDQLDDLEEVVSMMLDPSRTPTKAVFLFGPSRTGKGTFLRIMEAVVGIDNVSGVRLSQLCEDRFAAANVYGKALNVSGDLSAGHIEDISLFKQLTGDDLISADRKFGQQFVFRNTALFAFAANELPTVGEASRAYVERIRPFKFGRTFAGHEDPEIERQIVEHELPGVLVRWVQAWRRVRDRGAFRPTDPEIRREFETRSDRVKQWLEEEMIAILIDRETDEPRQFSPAELPAVLAAGSSCTPAEGAELPAPAVSTPTELTRMFATWANDNAGRPMGRNKLVERLTSINGVMRVRRAGTGVRGLNLVRRDGGDPWVGGEPPEPAVPAVSSQLLQPLENEVSIDSELCFSAVGEVGAELPELPADAAMILPRSLPGFADDGTQAIDTLLDLVPSLPAYDPGICPECDRPLALVPFSPKLGGGVWYACRHCTPDTFDRT